MTIDQSFKSCKRQDFKVGNKSKLDDENSYTDKRVLSKILTLDKNIQYSYAMAKPLPTGCIKVQKI